MTHPGHLRPSSCSPIDDGSNQRCPSSPSHLANFPSNPTHPTHPSNARYSSTQPGATDKSTSLVAHRSDLACEAFIRTDHALNMPNDLGDDGLNAHGTSSLPVMDRRRQRNHLASSSLPLPSPQQAGSNSFSSVAHGGAHSRLRAYPYRRPARNVRSSIRNTIRVVFLLWGKRTIVRPSDHKHLILWYHLISLHLASTSFKPSYAHSNKNGWGIHISRPSGSHPHLNLVPGVMRTSLRSSHPQQPSHIYTTNSPEFYDTDAFQLEPRYNFDLPYLGNDGAGWPDSGIIFFK